MTFSATIGNAVQDLNLLDSLNSLFSNWLALVALIVSVAFAINTLWSYQSKKDVEEALKENKYLLDIMKNKVNEMETKYIDVKENLQERNVYNTKLSLALTHIENGAYIESFLKEYPDDFLSNQLYGNYVLKEIQKEHPSSNSVDIDILRQALSSFVYIANNDYKVNAKQYQLGQVFHESIVYEIVVLASELIKTENREEETKNLLIQTFPAILRSLDINSESELKKLHITDIRLMNYIKLLHEFSISMVKNDYPFGYEYLERFILISYNNSYLIDEQANALDLLIEYYSFNEVKTNVFIAMKERIEARKT